VAAPETSAELAGYLDRLVRDVADYPKPGVVFKDITPLLGDAGGFRAVVDALVGDQMVGSVDKVAGVEARGFILAAPVAYRLGAGFVPIRKQGKLPSRTFEQRFALEYGEAVIEVHTDAFEPGDRVLLIDDVLATGGTAAAAAELVRRAGGTVVGLSVLIELGFLAGRAALPAGLGVRALLTT
jgi:adenine phosphoribosyltransferase